MPTEQDLMNATGNLLAKADQLANEVISFKGSNNVGSSVVSVNGKTGEVTLSKDDIGLENIDHILEGKARAHIPYPYLSTINKNSPTKAVPGVNIEGLALGEPRREPEADDGLGWYLINKSDFPFYVKRGFPLIRLPFLWENLQDDLYEDFQEKYWTYVKEYTYAAIEEGCEVILDLHNYAQYVSKQDGVKRYIGTPEVPYDAFFDIWENLAEEFGNKKGVTFCFMNEPTMPDADLPVWVQKNQELMLKLRDLGYTNHIQLSSNIYTSADGVMKNGNFKLFENIYDPLDNWSLELHQYIDKDLNGAGAAVGSTLESENPVEAYIRLKEVSEWARHKKIKIHLGEFGIAHDNTLYPMNQKAMYNYLRFIEDNADVFISFTVWGAASRGWGDYANGLFPHENQSTYDTSFEIGVRAGNEDVAEFTVYDIENEAYDPVNLQILKSFHKVNEQPAWADFVFDYEKGQYAGFDYLDEVVDFSRNSLARSENKLGHYELFIEDEARITNLGLNPEPARVHIFQTPLYTDIYNEESELEFTNIIAQKNIKSLDGTYNALRVTDDVVNGRHFMQYALESGTLIEGEALAASISARYVSERHAFFGFNGLNKNIVHDFLSSTPDAGCKEWVRLSLSGVKVGDGGAREIMWGHNGGLDLTVSHLPNEFVGTGTSTDFALPQIERCEFTGTNEEYEGDPFATSPIVGAAINAQRDADNYKFKGRVLEALNGDFTLFMEWHKIPVAACKMPIFKINGLNLLQRNANSAVGCAYANISTDPMIEGNREHLLGKKVAISVSKSLGKIILYAQGVAPVEVTGLTLPEVTSAALGNHAGFNKNIFIAREAYTSERIQHIVDFEV